MNNRQQSNDILGYSIDRMINQDGSYPNSQDANLPRDATANHTLNRRLICNTNDLIDTDAYY